MEHKDIPEGTEAHGEPTTEQRHDEEEGRETPLCTGCNPPATVHVSLHGKARGCEKQS